MTNRPSPRDPLSPGFKKHRTENADRIALSESDRRAQRKLQLACFFSLLFMGAEVVGGYLSGSLAIMTDAAHLLSDVAGFCISLFAIWMSQRPATDRLSYGFQRSEVIGAVTSVLVIWVLTGVLLYEAILRFLYCLKPDPASRVDGKMMFIVATIGLLVNLVLMKILGHGHAHGGHGHSHGGHGHTDEHSHEGHDHPHSGHGHSDGHSRGGHDHSHGGHGGHGHSHGGHGHSHGGHQGGNVENHRPSHSGLSSRGSDIYVDLHTPCDPDHHGHGERDNWVGGGLEVNAGGTAPKPNAKENLNIRAAYIHALGDFIQSLGVCAAGGLIWFNPEWQIADPIATFIFSILVMGTTFGIIRDSIHMLMEGTPLGMHSPDIEEGLLNCPAVVGVHDLHIWSLSAGLPSLSVHLVSIDAETALRAAQRFLLSKGITHSTIQIEMPLTKYPRDCAADLKCGQASPPQEVYEASCL
ncbi:hypothetical protein PF008_g17224 [Phytophthora fragariae]|uniref:Cation efflux protein cytoplasmic domain-containing protein n=1 Tax=Phytophthora fragariae TaxID=53985 RepID=A0A6G0R8U9_9STRA|nr:hypothetical protein PF008_g17224 [Phytophthora fragariae]